MAESAGNQALNPTALALEDTARLLSALGQRAISIEMLRADIEAGAPLNTDGTLNLVHYAAWLVQDAAATAGARHGD